MSLHTAGLSRSLELISVYIQDPRQLQLTLSEVHGSGQKLIALTPYLVKAKKCSSFKVCGLKTQDDLGSVISGSRSKAISYLKHQVQNLHPSVLSPINFFKIFSYYSSSSSMCFSPAEPFSELCIRNSYHLLCQK